MDACSTLPYLVRATGSASDARPPSTRRGCERESRTVFSSVRTVRAWSANALVVIAEISSMIPPRTCGRTLPHSAPAPSRHAPSLASPSRRMKAVSAASVPKAPRPSPPRMVPASAIHPTRRPSGEPSGRQPSVPPTASCSRFVPNTEAERPARPLRVAIIPPSASAEVSASSGFRRRILRSCPRLP